VGENLCEAVDLKSGERVLDVAAGNGNATLAAGRRWAEVTSTDYVGALLDRAKERAAAERQTITFQEADAEALPFADGSFDVVLSTFGVMFTPNQEQSGRELARVTRSGTSSSADSRAASRVGSNARARWSPVSRRAATPPTRPSACARMGNCSRRAWASCVADRNPWRSRTGLAG
jgi:ubiquinone/menaquinone biosynthesis C-methylase UbiE